MSILNLFSDGMRYKHYMKQHRDSINEHFKTTIDYYKDFGFLITNKCNSGVPEVVLVIILTDDCPYAEADEYVSSLELTISAALEEYYPFPHQPTEAVRNAFTFFVVIKDNAAAESGYTKVSWYSLLTSYDGKFGGKIC
ncbi:hypothetical protein F4677DRAFT_443768 [Hypoxylon crocopeplum]|nr:hypothetical protein F4677DRAFT_443768 [Hypoxylon crocopeplum]